MHNSCHLDCILSKISFNFSCSLSVPKQTKTINQSQTPSASLSKEVGDADQLSGMPIYVV